MNSTFQFTKQLYMLSLFEW